MIARVRIAPIEQWCEAAKSVPHKWKPGMICLIETTSMVIMKLKIHPQEARFWTGPKSDGDEKVICEHMLEID